MTDRTKRPIERTGRVVPELIDWEDTPINAVGLELKSAPKAAILRFVEDQGGAKGLKCTAFAEFGDILTEDMWFTIELN